MVSPSSQPAFSTQDHHSPPPSEQDRNGSKDDGTEDDSPEGPEFDPARCLFCNQMSANMDNNLDHMQKTHGLFILDTERALADVETLLSYFDLVIFGYCECLHCGSQRHTAEAVQQHMRGKGHCRFDFDGEGGAEFRELYGLEEASSETDDDETSPSDVAADGSQHNSTALVRAGKSVPRGSPASSNGIVQPTEDTLRLPSGKLLSRRTDRPSRTRPLQRPSRSGADVSEASEAQRNTEDGGAGSSRLSPQPDSTALTRADRRDHDFASRQLMQMRAEDRRSLMHLPVPEQRALLATRKKQLDKARRANRAMQGRVESLGNKTLMKHFVPDVPGRSNG